MTFENLEAKACVRGKLEENGEFDFGIRLSKEVVDKILERFDEAQKTLNREDPNKDKTFLLIRTCILNILNNYLCELSSIRDTIFESLDLQNSLVQLTQDILFTKEHAMLNIKEEVH